MAAEAGAWIEGGEAEGLGRGGTDDLPDIDVHFIGSDFQFVDESNVYGTIDIFNQLGEFRDLGGRNRDHLIECSTIESCTSI